MNLKTETGQNGFYQWDTNQVLIVENADACQEVHFGRYKDPTALVCSIREADGQRVVDVPNILLQSDKPITAYLFSHVGDGALTRYAESILVRSRPRPENYVYTETEVLSYEALEQRITDLEENGGTQGDPGTPGADGISCTHEWNGSVLTVTSASGTSSADLKGEQGNPGIDGYNPVRGTDYWTDADKAEIKAYVDEAILGGAW